MTQTPEMSNDDILTDSYVAELLAKEAADNPLKYSSMGIESSRTDKKYVFQRQATRQCI